MCIRDRCNTGGGRKHLLPYRNRAELRHRGWQGEYRTHAGEVFCEMCIRDRYRIQRQAKAVQNPKRPHAPQRCFRGCQRLRRRARGVSPDGNQIAFVRDNNIYLVKLLFGNSESQVCLLYTSSRNIRRPMNISETH